MENSNQSKKQLYRIYNEVSKELLGTGPVTLKIDIGEDLITFRAKHPRAQRSISLERETPDLKQKVDFQLSKIIKLKIKEKVEKELGVEITAILRDYDSPAQLAFTNIVFTENKIK